MLEIYATRFGIFLFISFSVFIIFTFLRFPLHTNSFQGAGILFAAIVPALILTIPLWQKLEHESSSIITFFFDEQKKELVPHLSYTRLIDKLSKDDYKATEINSSEVSTDTVREDYAVFWREKGFDIAEQAVVSAYIYEFLFQWVFDDHNFSGLSGIRTEHRPLKVGSKILEGQEVSVVNFAQHFPHNAVLQNSLRKIEVPYFRLPPDTLVSVPNAEEEQKEWSRTIKFLVRNEGNLTIEITRSNAGVFSGVENKGLRELSYKVTVRFSHYPHTLAGKAMSKWFENVSDLYKKLGWENKKSIKN